MQQPTWMRRLDDRADRVLQRRFGFGLVSGREPSLRKQVLITLAVLLPIAAVLAVAYISSGQGDRVVTLLGPVLGALTGTVLGRLIRDARRQRQVRVRAGATDSGHDRRR